MIRRDNTWRDLVRYLGSVSSAVGVSLFFLGSFGLLLSALALASGFSWRDEDKLLLLIPAWSLIAVPLGLSMRRKVPSNAVLLCAEIWLGAAVLSMFLGDYFG